MPKICSIGPPWRWLTLATVLSWVRLLADRGASLDACGGYHNHRPSSSIDGVFLRKGFIYSALSLTTKTQLYDLYLEGSKE